jgi:hypothetical protein
VLNKLLKFYIKEQFSLHVCLFWIQPSKTMNNMCIYVININFSSGNRNVLRWTTLRSVQYYLCWRIRRLIEGNAKSLRLNSNMKKVYAAAVYLSEVPSYYSCLGVVKQFCIDSESGPTQSVMSCSTVQYMVSNTTQHCPTPPFPATHSIHMYLHYSHKGGRVLNLREWRWTHPME